MVAPVNYDITTKGLWVLCSSFELQCRKTQSENGGPCGRSLPQSSLI